MPFMKQSTASSAMRTAPSEQPMATVARDKNLVMKSNLVAQKAPRKNAKVVQLKLDVGVLPTTPEKRRTLANSLIEGEKHPNASKTSGQTILAAGTMGQAIDVSASRSHPAKRPLLFTSQSFRSFGKEKQQASKLKKTAAGTMSWSAAVQSPKSVPAPSTLAISPIVQVSDPRNWSSSDWRTLQ